MSDPLQTEDPWSLYLASKDKNRKQVGGQPLVSAASAPPKPQATSLTQQVQVASSDIARISAHIEHQVLAKVQQQVDAATGALGQKVSSLETNVGAIQRKVENQEAVLQQMFNQQMSRIEELLVPKRPRNE